jgi:hypothetical protein
MSADPNANTAQASPNIAISGDDDGSAAEAISRRSGGVRGDGVGSVEPVVEQHGDGCGVGSRAAAPVQQDRRSQDQQRGRKVADAIQADAGEKRPERSGRRQQRSHRPRSFGHIDERRGTSLTRRSTARAAPRPGRALSANNHR